MLITFEGIDGCGKSTQVEMLVEHLVAAGISPIVLREPGGTPLGEHIRTIFKTSIKTGIEICPEAELMLFGAARAQLVRDVIKPALDKGRTVICDRFLDSTYAYQRCGRGMTMALTCSVADAATKGLRPDITFLLDLPPGIAAHRRAGRCDKGDRIESETVKFFETVREGYLSLAKRAEHRIFVKDATRSADDLSAEIWYDVQEKLSGCGGACDQS
jgi:dTMP kinase